MDFNFTEEQTLLRDSLSRLLGDTYDFDRRRALLQGEGWSRENWARFAELGLLAAPLPEAHGGLGGGPIESLVVMEEFGAALVLEPFIPTVVLSAGLIARAGSEAQQSEYLPAVAAGEQLLAAGFYEPKGRYNLAHVETTARADGAGFVLNGHKAVVHGAPMADHLIVSARTAGAPAESQGISLFLLPKSAPGVSTRDYPTNDGLRASEVHLENVRLGQEHLLGPKDAALPLIEEAVDHAIAALCAEAVGAMRATHAATMEYTRARKQFGQAIANFQVLQHRMVDIFMAVEQSVSMTYMAALKLGTPERARACAAAKVQIGRAGRFVGQAAVQTHGGMGVTDEMKVAHLFKRVTMIDSQFGNVDYHLRRFMGAAARVA